MGTVSRAQSSHGRRAHGGIAPIPTCPTSTLSATDGRTIIYFTHRPLFWLIVGKLVSIVAWRPKPNLLPVVLQVSFR